MSSVCHRPEVKRLLPGPRQAGCASVRGRRGSAFGPLCGMLSGNSQL